MFQFMFFKLSFYFDAVKCVWYGSGLVCH